MSELEYAVLDYLAVCDELERVRDQLQQLNERTTQLLAKLSDAHTFLRERGRQWNRS